MTGTEDDKKEDNTEPQDKPENTAKEEDKEEKVKKDDSTEAEAEKKEEAAVDESKDVAKKEEPEKEKEESEVKKEDATKEDDSDVKKEEAAEEKEESSEKKDSKPTPTPTPVKDEDDDARQDVTPAKNSSASPSSSRKKKKLKQVDALTGDSVKAPSSGKRERKSIENFSPLNFKEHAQQEMKIPRGRGEVLNEIESVRENIKATSMNAPSINAAHKLLFSIRGKCAQKVKKGHILSFSGYLSPLVEGEDEKKRAELDEDAEAKMAAKAFKLKVPDIKMLCDFFDVDRSASHDKPILDKESLVDRLLDFLGAPDPKLTKAYMKRKKSKDLAKKRRKTEEDEEEAKEAKKRSTKKAKKKKEESEEDEDEETEEEEEEEEDEEDEAMDVDGEKKMPSDKALRKWVRAYVTCFNLDKATTKHAIETASDKFGVDLTEKKVRIKELLTEEMT